MSDNRIRSLSSHTRDFEIVIFLIQSGIGDGDSALEVCEHIHWDSV